MSLRSFVAVLAFAAACGGAGTPSPTTRIADPIPMPETQPAPAVAVDPAPAHEPVPEPVAVAPAPTSEPTRPTGPAAKSSKPRPRPVAPTRVDILVTSAGFEPRNVTVPRGRPVILRFQRKVERTCGTEVVMTVDGQKIERELPLNESVEVPVTFGTAGVVSYSCSMDMLRGSITVQ